MKRVFCARACCGKICPAAKEHERASPPMRGEVYIHQGDTPAVPGNSLTSATVVAVGGESHIENPHQKVELPILVPVVPASTPVEETVCVSPV